MCNNVFMHKLAASARFMLLLRLSVLLIQRRTRWLWPLEVLHAFAVPLEGLWTCSCSCEAPKRDQEAGPPRCHGPEQTLLQALPPRTSMCQALACPEPGPSP